MRSVAGQVCCLIYLLHFPFTLLSFLTLVNVHGQEFSQNCHQTSREMYLKIAASPARRCRPLALPIELWRVFQDATN